jgi:hypothetical protein
MPKRTIIDVKQQQTAAATASSTQASRARLEVWDISGAFILPGTRKRVGLSKVRVIAKDRAAASADLVPILLEKFQRELPEGQTFSKQFAIYHLQWERFQHKEAPIPQPTETANEEPAKTGEQVT